LAQSALIDPDDDEPVVALLELVVLSQLLVAGPVVELLVEPAGPDE
jgi:hypothetical protein